MAGGLRRWFSESGFRPGEPAPREARILRGIGLAGLIVVIVATITTDPAPGLHGRHLGVLAALLMLVYAITRVPLRWYSPRAPVWLWVIAASGLLLGAFQPHGAWSALPFFVAVVGAARLPLRPALALLIFSIAGTIVVAAVQDQPTTVWSTAWAVLPWFLVMRLFRRSREEIERTEAALDELKASRAAEAAAAADAERARVAREMHDVLAHTLSSLALHLETTRLLARDDGSGAEVVAAIDQAHHLAAGGLDEARRAIGALRGDDLPGPERLDALAQAFTEQSGIPVDFAVTGEPRPLAADARLALYRTAQEALTNVRRHADAERVEVRLAYRADGVLLEIRDHSRVPVPTGAASPGHGYGLTGMRERAELLGGRLEAGPGDGGFRVELRLP